MAINLSQAFHRTSSNPIDETLALTKVQMLATVDALMPNKYMTVCQDDGKIYLYDKTNTSDETTGKFRVFEGEPPHTIEDYLGNDMTQRDKLLFSSDFNVSDDSVSEKTIVKLNQEVYSLVAGQVETSYTASKDYEAGESFVLEGKLYKAKKDITAGDALIPAIRTYIFSESLGINNDESYFNFYKINSETVAQYVPGTGIDIYRAAWNNADGWAAFKKQMYDLTPYATLTMKCTPPNSSTYQNIGVFVKNDLTAQWIGITHPEPDEIVNRGWATKSAQTQNTYKSAPFEVVLDISSVNKEQYIWVGNAGANYARTYITDLWLENDSSTVNIEEYNIIDEMNQLATLESSVTSNLAVGAIASGTTIPLGTTFTEFVQKLLITEIAPTISFSLTKSGNVVYGSSYTETLTVNISNMGTAKKIKTIAWYEGDTLKQTDTIDSSTTGSHTYTMSSATTDTTTFKAVVTYTKSDDSDTSVTKTSSISFYYNKFYGAVDDLAPSEATVEALTSVLGTSKGGTYSFTVTAGRICYAYPKSLGTISSIKDGNGFSLFDSFTREEVSYTQNGASVPYYRYVLTDATSVSSYSVTFA